MESLQRAVQLGEELARRDPNEYSSRERIFSAEVISANILRDSDPRRALEMCHHALERLAEIKDSPSARLHEVEALAASAYPLQRLGRDAEARRNLDLAFQALRENKLYPAQRIKVGSEAGSALRALAQYEEVSGDILRASGLYKQLLDTLIAANPKPESSLSEAVALSNLYRSAAPVHRRARNPELASDLESRRLQLWQRWQQKLPDNAFVHLQLAAAAPR